MTAIDDPGEYMNGKNYLRIIIYFVLLLLCFSIQNTAGLMPRFFGTLPLLTAAFAYAVSVYDGRASLSAAVVAGILTEVTLGTVIGPCTIVMIAISLVAVWLSDRFDTSVPFVILFGAPYSFIICAATFLSGSVQTGITLSFGELMLLALCRGAYTWLWCTVFCLFFKKTDR